MAKDLILGAASNYTYDHVKYWINSIQRSGFQGDIVLVVTNMYNSELAKIAEKGVNILAYGQKDQNGNFVHRSNMAPHLERFFFLWNFLRQCEQYRYVVTTDVRDVVFQTNPIAYLEKINLEQNEGFIAASEGLLYKDEPWGSGNLEIAFGPFFHSIWKENEIFNVGIMAGTHARVRDMLLMIYQMGMNRPFEVVDQAAYNFLLGVEAFGKDVVRNRNDEGWAVNLGTTIYAIESGHGDIGRLATEETMKQYHQNYIGEQPIISGDLVLAADEDPYVIVHQYDRVTDLTQKIMDKYDDAKAQADFRIY